MQGKGFIPEPNRAGVYVSRALRILNVGVATATYLDDYSLGQLDPGTYQVVSVVPGEHVLKVVSVGSPYDVEFSAEAGKNYFFGVDAFRLCPHLLEEEVGKKAILNSRRVMTTCYLLPKREWPVNIAFAQISCENHQNPVGITVAEPRLGWLPYAYQRRPRGNVRQTDWAQSAYQILVASSEEALSKGIGDLWDTGKINSEQSEIVYAGKALISQMSCYWKVRVWGDDGAVSSWSNAASWTMGMLAAAPEQGRESVADHSRKGATQTEQPERPLPVRSPTMWTPGARRFLWVLAIGVGQYKDSQIPPLPYARADAERVRDWFISLNIQGMTRDNTRVLLDEQATRENLLVQIDWLRKQALFEDAVIIYFACHGAPELASDGASVDAKYLVLHDTDPSQLFSTGFSLDDLARKLDAVKAKTQVLILEACYAGPVGEQVLKKTPTADLEIRPRLIQQLGEKPGRVILSGSSGRQIAIESDEVKGGLFTRSLLGAWGDGTRPLLSERFDEVRYQVRRASNRLGSLQEPAKFGDQNLDIVLKER